LWANQLDNPDLLLVGQQLLIPPADGVLYTRAGLEIGVAATKTYTGQLACLYLLAYALGAPLCQEDLQHLSEDAAAALDTEDEGRSRAERYCFMRHASERTPIAVRFRVCEGNFSFPGVRLCTRPRSGDRLAPVKTDDDLQPFMDKRVRARLKNGVEGSGVLEPDEHWNGRPMFRRVGSAPGTGVIYTSDMEFFAAEVDEIEPL